MPINNSLEPVKLPMEQKWNKEPETIFMNNLDAIEITCIDGPTHEDLMKYIPNFVNATWNDEPLREYDQKFRAQRVYDTLHFKTLPTAMETIGYTFCIKGISMQEVSHILRHRRASFSAECSGDKWWTDKIALIPNSVQHSNGKNENSTFENPDEDDIHNRYMKLVAEAKQLYQDMIDTKKISIMDARYILPRCLETYYFMRMSYNDIVAFCKQRFDTQIQPETDNIIAYKMWKAVLEKNPLAFGVINPHDPKLYGFYKSTFRQGTGTNLYWPCKDADDFEFNEKDTIYPCTRDKMNGTDENAPYYYGELAAKLDKELEELEAKGKKLFEDLTK